MAYYVPVTTPAAGGTGTRTRMLPTRMPRSMSVPNSTSIAIIRPGGSRWITPTGGSPAPKGGDESRGLPGGVQNSVSRFYKGGLSTVSPPRSPETWEKGATPIDLLRIPAEVLLGDIHQFHTLMEPFRAPPGGPAALFLALWAAKTHWAIAAPCWLNGSGWRVTRSFSMSPSTGLRAWELPPGRCGQLAPFRVRQYFHTLPRFVIPKLGSGGASFCI